MGQKTHTNLLKLENSKYWSSKYFEKKLRDYPLYSKKDLEIWLYIKELLKKNGLVLKDCKLCFLSNSLHIFISYYQSLDPAFSIGQSNQKKVYSLTRHFFETISEFLFEKWHICLIFQKSTNYFKNKYIGKILIKKLLTRLRWYKFSKFFKEAIDIMVICAMQKSSAGLLVRFITKHLKYQKSHTFFLNFLKKSFVAIKSVIRAPFKGIKIIIKGWLNNRPWARKKIVSIVNNISYSASSIDYAEKTVFTSNGTIGIKLWILEN